MLLHGSINGTATYVQVLADRGVISSDAAGFSTGIRALLTAALAALLIGWRTHRTLGYPRYRYEAEHLDLGRPLGAAVSERGQCRDATSAGRNRRHRSPGLARLHPGCERRPGRRRAPVSPQAQAAGLIDVRTVVPDAIVDPALRDPEQLRRRRAVPARCRCLVHESLAPGLAIAASELRAKGLTLVFWDCYRPHEVQVRMFEEVPTRAGSPGPAITPAATSPDVRST